MTDKGPRILILDIETSLLVVKTFDTGDTYIQHSQIKKDWTIMSWAAKWHGARTVMQCDARKRSEKSILKELRKVLGKADIVVTQNGKKFDIPRINSRMIKHGLKPYKTFQQIDTCQLAKKHFGFSSNSLEYLAKTLKLKHQKLKHKKFPGQDLWDACDAGSIKAWREMAKYNKHDVLVTEDLYNRISPWCTTVNFNVYYGDLGAVCKCGSKKFRKNGHNYTSTGKYPRFECKKCGDELRARKNLLKGKKLSTLLVNTRR